MNLTELLDLTSPKIPTQLTPLALRNYARKARIQLRKVDIILKDEGIEAAIGALMEVSKKIPLNDTTCDWIEDYLKMLHAWQDGVMPEVVDEFTEFGYRRASSIIHNSMKLMGRKLKTAAYRNCLNVFDKMDERAQSRITDLEEEMPPELRPKAEEECEGDDDDVELDELDQEEIAQMERQY